MEQKRIASESGEKVDAIRVPVHVMIDGPYGGCGLDLGEYENVLLVAGGVGVTFTLGLLDDLVGRVVRHERGRSERTRRVEFAWIISSFGKQLDHSINIVPESLTCYICRQYPVVRVYAHGHCECRGQIVTSPPYFDICDLSMRCNS
jgi:hypothetical protein